MDQSETVPKPKRIGVLPIEGFALLSYACVVEPLRAANLLSRQTLYDVTHFSPEDMVHSSGAAIAKRDSALSRCAGPGLSLCRCRRRSGGFRRSCHLLLAAPNGTPRHAYWVAYPAGR